MKEQESKKEMATEKKYPGVEKKEPKKKKRHELVFGKKGFQKGKKP